MAEARADLGRERSGGHLDLLRLLYAPWTFLVFIPILALSTAVLGSIAILIAPFSQKRSHDCGTVWAWLLCRANFTRVHVVGLEHMRPGQSYVVMSNHESLFDVLAFYGHWPRQFRWVIKQEIRRVPFLGRACVGQGHIFIDRSNREQAISGLKAAQESTGPGVSIVIFPEGSRSRDGRLGQFKKGGFMMALDMGLPILPVSISGASRVLPGRSFGLLPGTITIRVHDPIETRAYGLDGRDGLMADVRAAIASGLAGHEPR